MMELDLAALGKIYKDGETIIRQGETGDCMFVVQAGEVEIVREVDGIQVQLAVRGEGEFFGEMAIFEREVRSATVRALGQARVVTLDKKTFLRRVHEDPSLALHMLERMSNRIRELSAEVTQLRIEKTSSQDEEA